MFRRTLRRLKAPPQPVMLPASKTGGLASGPPRGATRPMIDEFHPSSKVLKFAEQFNMAYPDSLRLVPGQKFDDFPIRLSVCNRHVFSYYHLGFINALEHPLTDKTLHFYAQEQSKPLWCYVQAAMADGSKAVVRHTSERVVRAALFRALNATGYDSCGRKLDGSAGQICGTIRIGVSQPRAILKVEFDRLVEYLSKLVASAVPRLAGARKPVP